VSKHKTPTICSDVQTGSAVHPSPCSIGPVVVSLRESYFHLSSKFLKNISLVPCSATVSCLLRNPGLLNLVLYVERSTSGNIWSTCVQHEIQYKKQLNEYIIIPTIRTNRMHYLLSIYFNN